jgi:hypothetical protein
MMTLITIAEWGWDKSNFVPVPFCIITIITDWKRAPKGNFLPRNRLSSHSPFGKPKNGYDF